MKTKVKEIKHKHKVVYGYCEVCGTPKEEVAKNESKPNIS